MSYVIPFMLDEFTFQMHIYKLSSGQLDDFITFTHWGLRQTRQLGQFSKSLPARFDCATDD